jgi:hypothetical protein
LPGKAHRAASAEESGYPADEAPDGKAPAARARLVPRSKAYLRALDPGVRLGYRRHQLGGKWLWSVYNGDGSYSAKTFAGADDFLRPDGERILDYGQAIARVRELASAPPIGPTTVAEAMDAYFKRLAAKGKKTADAERRANTHIVKPLGAVPVDALTRDILDRWLANVANGRDGAGPTRARKATANRVATILHAALNQAFRDDKCASDRAEIDETTSQKLKKWLDDNALANPHTGPSGGARRTVWTIAAFPSSSHSSRM